MAVLPQQKTFSLFPVSSIQGYDLLAVLSPGPLGTLYRVRQRNTGELAELLLLVSPTARSSDEAKKALWEQTTTEWRRALTALMALEPHPQIARLLEFGEVEAGFYLLMQPSEGITVRQLLERRSARSPEWTLVLCAQIAAALDFAAGQGFAHGDLSPNNVVLESATNEVRLRYFGLHFLPLHGVTPYTSPEQTDGREADARSDIYALGALLYAYVSGEPPFAAESPEALGRKIRSGPPAPLPDQPPWMQDILARAMRPDPAARYRHAGDIVTDLRFQRSPAMPPPEENSAPIDRPDIPEPDAPPGALQTELGLRAGRQWNPLRQVRRAADATDGAISLTDAQAPRPGLWARVRYFMEQTRDLWHALPRETRLPAGTRFAVSLGSRNLLNRLKGAGRAACIILLPLLLLLSAHAGWLAHAYQRAEVQDRHWYATARMADRTRFLQIGDTLEGPDQPLLTTKNGVELALLLVDSRITLPPNSQMKIKRLGYENGRIRNLELLKGRVRVDVQPEAGPEGRYDVWCHNVHVWTSAGRFVVTAQARGAEIRSLDGQVWVSNGPTRWVMMEGQHLSAQTGKLMDIPRPISLHDHKQLASVFPKAEAPTPLMNARAAYLRLQQKTLMPLVARLFRRFL